MLFLVIINLMEITIATLTTIKNNIVIIILNIIIHNPNHITIVRITIAIVAICILNINTGITTTDKL